MGGAGGPVSLMSVQLPTPSHPTYTHSCILCSAKIRQTFCLNVLYVENFVSFSALYS